MASAALRSLSPVALAYTSSVIRTDECPMRVGVAFTYTPATTRVVAA